MKIRASNNQRQSPLHTIFALPLRIKALSFMVWMKYFAVSVLHIYASAYIQQKRFTSERKKMNK